MVVTTTTTRGAGRCQEKTGRHIVSKYQKTTCENQEKKGLGELLAKLMQSYSLAWLSLSAVG
jgi:hypothetical protein